MDNLNKENYFDDLTEKYPYAMLNFLSWIDEYKKAINWRRLFNPRFRTERISGHGFTALDKEYEPKFHDLPYEMQFGIMLKFVTDKFEEEGIDAPEFKELFETCLNAIQKEHG